MQKDGCGEGTRTPSAFRVWAGATTLAPHNSKIENGGAVVNPTSQQLTGRFRSSPYLEMISHFVRANTIAGFAPLAHEDGKDETQRNNPEQVQHQVLQSLTQ